MWQWNARAHARKGCQTQKNNLSFAVLKSVNNKWRKAKSMQLPHRRIRKKRRDKRAEGNLKPGSTHRSRGGCGRAAALQLFLLLRSWRTRLEPRRQPRDEARASNRAPGTARVLTCARVTGGQVGDVIMTSALYKRRDGNNPTRIWELKRGKAKLLKHINNISIITLLNTLVFN